MAAPARVTIGNLDTGLALDAQYNPTRLKESIKANFTELVVPGLSHPILQYVATGAHQMAFDLGFDQLSNPSFDIGAARRFLLSFMVPSRSARDVVSGAPPEALFLWPGWISLRCKIESIELEHRLFSPDGPPTWFVASIAIKEARDTRLYSEDVAVNGTLRGSR